MAMLKAQPLEVVSRSFIPSLGYDQVDIRCDVTEYSVMAQERSATWHRQRTLSVICPVREEDDWGDVECRVILDPHGIQPAGDALAAWIAAALTKRP